MKIQTLKIHNIASIEDAQIDFDKAPLADDPLFLITGETGSGKTTILNAICLALYNQVPALKSIGSAEVDKEGLQTNNPRQLLRRGTGEAAIELAFVGNDEKHYRAVWRVQRAHKKITGAYQNVVRVLYIKEGEAEISYTRKDEIDRQIQEAIGLTFEQFTRTTLLAQGQFASFMKASDNEKSEILEKLTGTEIYARIGQRVFVLMQKAKDDFNALDNQIKGANPLRTEEKEAMQLRIAELSEQIKAADTVLKTQDAQIAWLTESAKLQATLAAKLAEQQNAEAAIASEEYRQRKTTVTDWEATAEIRDTIAKENAEAKELAALKQKLDNLTVTFTSIAGGIEWQKLQLQKTAEQKAELDKTLEAEAINADMYANAGQIKVLANNVSSFVEEHQRQTKELERINADKKKSQEEETRLQAAQKDASDKFAAQETEVKKLEAEVGTIDLPAMTRKVNEIADSILKTKTSISNIKQWLQTKAEWEEAERLLKEAVGEQTGQQKVLDENKAKLPALELDYAAKHGYLEGQMKLNDHIRELRQRFQEQNVCPLCGNPDTHLHNDEELDCHLTTAKEQEAKAKKALDETKDIIVKTETALKSLSSTIKSRKTQAEAKQKNKVAAESTAKAAYTDYASEDAIAVLETSLTKLEEQRGKEHEALNAATMRQKALETVRQTLETLRTGKDKAEKEYTRQTQKMAELEQQAKTLTGLIDGTKVKADNALAEMSQLLAAGTTATLKDAKTVSLDIEKRAKAYNESQKKAQTLAAQLESQTNQIKANESAFVIMRSRFATDAPVQPAEKPNLEAEIIGFVTKVNNIDGGIEQTSKRLDALQKELDDYFASQDKYSKERVIELNTLSRDTIAAYKLSIENADKQLADTKAAVKTINEQQEANTKTRPQMDEDATAETLTVARTQKAEERDTANNELVAIRTQLEKDKQLAASLEDKQKECDRLQKEKDSWEILDRAFGGADGKKFRNIAQSYVLRALLYKANHYLGMLNNRYLLDCEDGSLTINVIDQHQGNAVRNVGLLSGGEGFVVSLALALGLSSISSSNLNVDTLFIDEGFGTLSNDYLETVINTLDRLHQQGGRRVGIISHVEGLKERIPTQICLRRTGPSSSKIEVVS